MRGDLWSDIDFLNNQYCPKDDVKIIFLQILWYELLKLLPYFCPGEAVRPSQYIIKKFFSGKCGDALNSAIYFINKVDIYMKTYIRYLDSDQYFFRNACDGRTKSLYVRHVRPSHNVYWTPDIV